MRSILLDANCVIELFEIGKWKQFLDANRVFLPSIVADEAQHYYDSSGWKDYIVLKEDTKSGSVIILETIAIELINIGKRLETFKIDKGELQAIAILCQEYCEEIHFCTADGDAVIACYLLGLEDQCISLERALESSGLTCRVKKQFTDEFMKKWKKVGFEKKARDKGWSQT